MESRYNGWRNYETWVTNLWLTNDEGTDGYWREQAREAWDVAEAREHFTREENARLELARRLKDEIEEGSPCPEAGLYSDLLNAALSEIDWHEVAESFLEGIPGEEQGDRDEA